MRRLEAKASWGRMVELAEVVREVPGLKYMAAVQGLRRFGARLEKDEAARRFVARLRHDLSTQ